MTKSMSVLRKTPMLTVTAPASLAASNQSDQRHDDVSHERRNDLAEGRTDDDTDGHVDHVPAHREFFEFL
jgi:hypothetical protein